MVDNMEIPENLWGKYKLISSDNFDEFLKEIGIGYVKRKLANASYPTLEIMKGPNEGDYILKADATFKKNEVRFRLNEEFDELRMDDKIVKSIVEYEPPNKVVQTQRDGDLVIKYIRELIDDKIKVTSIANNVECIRWYQRLPFK